MGFLLFLIPNYFPSLFTIAYQFLTGHENLLIQFKILRDYDNYTDALRDYKYAQYKNSFANQTRYATKIDALKVFFPKTGKTKKK